MPFSRSMRALQLDNFRLTALGLSLAALLFTAWGLWFFGAKIAIYQISHQATLTHPTQAQAQFPITALGHIKIGQTAYLRLSGFPWVQYGLIPATVKNINRNTQQNNLNITLSLHPPPNTTIPLQADLPGQAEIQTEQLSPATLLLRAVGYRLNPNAKPPPKTNPSEASP